MNETTEAGRGVIDRGKAAVYDARRSNRLVLRRVPVDRSTAVT